MKGNRSLFVIVLLAALMTFLTPCPAGAQTQTAPEGKTWGSYNVQQSVEFGYRFSDDWQKGNPRLFDNFVNLHEGPRMLDQTLFMRSLTNDAPLFDTLSITSFGFGGDPNNAARVKLSKNKWYNFSGSFRRDQNFFDYPLFGNPLNPTTGYQIGPNPLLGVAATTVPTPQLNDSAHGFAVRRRMSDFDLTLLPEAKISVRLGYSRNRSTGPSFSSFHEGTDFLIGGGGDNTNTTDNTYRIGADFKLLPKTTISYDQTLDYYKNDTGYNLGNGLRYTTWAPAGYTAQVIDFGLPFYGSPTNNPCANFFVNTSLQANPNCSGIWLTNPVTGLPGYSRYQKARTSTPSEQLSFVSRAIPKVDLSGRYIYSAASLTSPLSEDFYGAVTRTQERRWGQAGTSVAEAINNAAELSATIHVTDKLRIVDIFRFNAWRTPILQSTNEWSQVPGAIASSNSCISGIGACSGSTPAPVLPGDPKFTPFLLMPIVGAFTPTQALAAANSSFGAHNTSTGADVANLVSGSFLGQNAKSNTIQIEYDLTKRLGGRIGYRYGSRRDAQKDGYLSGTEYYYPNPDTAKGAPATIGTGSSAGIKAALRGDCAAGSGPNISIAANGVCTVTIADALSEPDIFDVTEHTALFGLWARPTHAVRLNGEVELTSADGAVTRISARQEQHYRFRSTWQLSPWATLSATYNGIERKNPGSLVPPLPATVTVSGVTSPLLPALQPNTLDIGYQGHSRSFGVSTSFYPSARFGLDLSYNINDFEQTALVCPVYTNLTNSTTTGAASTVLPSLPVCPIFPDQIVWGTLPGNAAYMTATAGGNIVSGENLQNGKYNSLNHFVSLLISVRPVKKLLTQVGTSWSNNGGNMLVLSPWLGVGTPVNVPANAKGLTMPAVPNTYGSPSSLANNYFSPMISVSYDVTKNWTAKATWNYYTYAEKAVATGVSNPENFHANTGMVSIRYAF